MSVRVVSFSIPDKGSQKSFPNCVKSNRNQIVFTMHRLIRNSKRTSFRLLFHINRYMVNSIWFDSIIFTKDFSVCSSVWDAQASRDKGNLFRSPPQYHIAGGFLRWEFRGTTNGSPWCGEVVGSPVAVSLMNFPVLVIDRRRVRKWSSTRCFLKNFQVFIWLVPITMVTVYYVTMVMLYAYYFRCVYPVLLIHKST